MQRKRKNRSEKKEIGGLVYGKYHGKSFSMLETSLNAVGGTEFREEKKGRGEGGPSFSGRRQESIGEERKVNSVGRGAGVSNFASPRFLFA